MMSKTLQALLLWSADKSPFFSKQTKEFYSHPSSYYKALNRLTNAGFIEKTKHGKRWLYHLTNKGLVLIYLLSCFDLDAKARIDSIFESLGIRILYRVRYVK